MRCQLQSICLHSDSNTHQVSHAVKASTRAAVIEPTFRGISVQCKNFTAAFRCEREGSSLAVLSPTAFVFYCLYISAIAEVPTTLEAAV